MPDFPQNVPAKEIASDFFFLLAALFESQTFVWYGVTRARAFVWFFDSSAKQHGHKMTVSEKKNSLLFECFSIVLCYNQNNSMRRFSMNVNHNTPHTLWYNGKQYHQRACRPIRSSPSPFFSSISSSSQSTTCLLLHLFVGNRCKSGELATVSSPEVWFPGCLIALTCQWCALRSP